MLTAAEAFKKEPAHSMTKPTLPVSVKIGYIHKPPFIQYNSVYSNYTSAVEKRQRYYLKVTPYKPFIIGDNSTKLPYSAFSQRSVHSTSSSAATLYSAFQSHRPIDIRSTSATLAIRYAMAAQSRAADNLRLKRPYAGTRLHYSATANMPKTRYEMFSYTAHVYRPHKLNTRYLLRPRERILKNVSGWSHTSLSFTNKPTYLLKQQKLPTRTSDNSSVYLASTIENFSGRENFEILLTDVCQLTSLLMICLQASFMQRLVELLESTLFCLLSSVCCLTYIFVIFVIKNSR